MVLVLVVGDLHVPRRAHGIPQAFTKMFVPGRIHTVLVTGNIGCTDTYDYLRTISQHMCCVTGDEDGDVPADLPESAVVEVEDLRIGLIHGHQVVPLGDKDSLGAVQRELGVDILVSGGTHLPKIHEFDMKLFVNPGSLTGAESNTECDVMPSFVLLDIQEKSVVCFTYQLSDEVEDGDDGDKNTSGLRVKKKEWRKE